MCEFNVILNGKTLFREVIYAKIQGNTVTFKNVMGETREFQNCAIEEIDVNRTKMVLKAVKP
jgi:predicted RNA-binding protein